MPIGYWSAIGSLSGIGLLSKDLQTLDWVQRGNQKCRVTSAIVEPDCLLYGTDSDRERNFIIRLEKQSGAMHEVREVNGSSFHAASFGALRLISASAEPNPICATHECVLYASSDGDRWERMVTYPKDRYNSHFFQIGTIVLPYNYGDKRSVCTVAKPSLVSMDKVQLFEVVSDQERQTTEE